MRCFNWCRSRDTIIGYRRIWFGSEVQESFMITPKYAFIFLDQLQAMFNSNEVLNYSSDYYSSELQSKLTRKLFSRFSLFGNLERRAIMKPKTTPKRKTTTTEGQRNKNMLWGDKSKSRSSRSSFSKRAPTVIFILGKVPFWEEGREGGDSKGRVINKKHTILGESDLICFSVGRATL